MGRGGTSSSHN
jgi:sterol desaturase/sphingolipid hydroxylase (fatty acid hydroxylase superfamily)